MKTLWLIFFVAQVQAASSTSTRYEKGFFSLNLLSGYTQSRTLNTDATYSGFSGMNYAVQLEVSITQSQSGDIRLFTQWGHDETKENGGVYKIKSDGFIAGLKFYANPYFYLQSGYGQISQSFSSSTASYKVQNSLLSAGAGFDYPITDNLSLGLLAQYSTNAIKKTSAISGNSFSEMGQYFLQLSWSPPITIINNTTNSGR